MSGVNVEGGSTPLVAFCWIRCMAKENCSRFSFPVCLVSASPLQTSTFMALRNKHSVFTSFEQLTMTAQAFLCVCRYAQSSNGNDALTQWETIFVCSFTIHRDGYTVHERQSVKQKRCFYAVVLEIFSLFSAKTAQKLQKLETSNATLRSPQWQICSDFDQRLVCTLK